MPIYYLLEYFGEYRTRRLNVAQNMNRFIEKMPRKALLEIFTPDFLAFWHTGALFNHAGNYYNYSIMLHKITLLDRPFSAT